MGRIEINPLSKVDEIVLRDSTGAGITDLAACVNSLQGATHSDDIPHFGSHNWKAIRLTTNEDIGTICLVFKKHGSGN